MSDSFDMPEEFGGPTGDYLAEPGTYHALVSEVKRGQGPKGTPVDGNSYLLHILGGTNPGQEGKSFTLTLFAPKLNGSDAAQNIARRAIAAMYIACDLVSPAQLGQKVTIDVEQCLHKQIVINLEVNTYEGKDRLQLHYDRIYHVDDPRSEGIPKDAEALASIDKSCRHDQAWFAPLGNRKGGTSAAQPARQPVGAGVNLDDL